MLQANYDNLYIHLFNVRKYFYQTYFILERDLKI
jgi:hypothetical protein